MGLGDGLLSRARGGAPVYGMVDPGAMPMKHRLCLMLAALIGLAADSQRLATFETAGVDVSEVLRLVAGERTAIAHPTIITSVPQQFSGWSFAATKPGNRFTIEPRSSGLVYIAGERHLATGRDWDAWQDMGADIEVQKGGWVGKYRVFSRDVRIGKRVRTPAEPYVIVLVPPHHTPPSVQP